VTAALTAAAQDVAREVLANEVTIATGAVEDGVLALELEGSKVVCRLEQ
jgi:archaeosine-15-forming tRNA-guanine transglycosylase